MPLEKALPYPGLSTNTGLITAPAMTGSSIPDLQMLQLRLKLLRQSIDEMEELLVRFETSEEALRKSEQQFRLLVEGVTDYAIFMLNPRGYILSWNAGAQRIKGYTADEIIGQHFSVFYPPADVAEGKLERELATATREGRYAEEGWRVRKDGSLFWANVLITGLFDDQGVLQGFAKVTRDMTERKLAEEQHDLLREQETQLIQEREARARAEAMNQLRQEFLMVVAHELRTPVTSLLGYAELLMRRSEHGRLTPDNIQHPVRTIIEQSYRLDKLTGMLLDVTRRDGEQFTVSLAPLNLVELLQRVVRGLHVLAEGHTIELHPLPEHPTVMGDQLRLEQVFYNLLHNAIKYSPEGSRITVAMAIHGEQLKVDVCDEGVGIPASDLPHIFERFYRATNVDAQHTRGMGVGLYLVSELVARHNGSIEATSVLGSGSTFTVTLPLHAPR
jgi:PAS domain S-box-containing protein